MLSISNLNVQLADSQLPIINGLNLELSKGQLHAIMGPNGSGKSTLASTLLGHPDYEVVDGAINFDSTNLLDLEPEERAAAGLFIGFQYPPSLPGVSVIRFLHLSRTSLDTARGLPVTSFTAFVKELKAAMKQIGVPWSFAEREVNYGFSGGEKKRLEMVQCLVLQPKLVVLDEIDSGLDVDALKAVAEGINTLRKANPDISIVIITHYNRILSYLKPDAVHIMQAGVISRSGDHTLATHIEDNGYGE